MADAPPVPLHADPVWEPLRAPERVFRDVDAATRFAQDAAVFHDGPTPSGVDLVPDAPLALRIGDFRGTYLSLALDLPPPALAGLGRDHILGLGFTLDAGCAAAVYVRLNLDPGARLLASAPAGPAARVEFDLWELGAAQLDSTAGWIDLIFERPGSGLIRFGGPLAYRRPRAMF